MFYKFRPVDKFAIDILLRNRLYLADWSSLNDAHEAIMHITDNGLNYHANPTRLREIAPELGTDYPTEVRLACLSRSWSGNQMWSHYARSHTGIAIGVFLPSLGKMTKLDVTYNDKIVSTSPPISRNTVLEALTYKSSEWKRESETRLVSFHKGVEFLEGITIKEVVFGLRTSDSDRELVMRLLDGRSVKFSKICYKPGFYNLNRTDIRTVKYS